MHTVTKKTLLIGTLGVTILAMAWLESIRRHQDSDRTSEYAHERESLAPEVVALNGTYTLCREAFWQNETLILDAGGYRYWFGSDVIMRDPPSYPVRGLFAVSATSIKMDVSSEPRASSRMTHWTIGTLNGTRVLWSDAGLAYYHETGRVHIYSLLVHSGPPLASYTSTLECRPSCQLIGVTRTGERL